MPLAVSIVTSPQSTSPALSSNLSSKAEGREKRKSYWHEQKVFMLYFARINERGMKSRGVIEVLTVTELGFSIGFLEVGAQCGYIHPQRKRQRGGIQHSHGP